MLLPLRWKRLKSFCIHFQLVQNLILNNKRYLAGIYNLQRFLTLCLYWFLPATWYGVFVMKVVSKIHSILRDSRKDGAVFRFTERLAASQERGGSLLFGTRCLMSLPFEMKHPGG